MKTTPQFFQKIRGFFFVLVLLIAAPLLGCQQTPQTDTSPAKDFIITDEYTNLRIAELDAEIKAGNTTPAEAQTILQTELRELKKLNDGSIQSILAKLEMMDPVAAKRFEETIREKHPDLFK